MADRRLADPGWYPDPGNDRDTFRWWTGSTWTAWLTTDPGAAPPPHAREDLGPLAAAEVPPRPPARFGTVPRIAMAAVVVALVLAAVVVTGWNDRERVALTEPAPTGSASLPDLSLSCEDPWSVAGELRMPVTDDFVVVGPRRSEPFPYLHCRARVNETNGNTLVGLGMADGVVGVDETLQQHAERRMNEFAATIYKDGPARVVDMTSEAYDPLTDAWRVRGDLLVGDDDPTADHVEVIVLDLENGRRAIWVQLVGDKVQPEAKKLITDARDSLERY